MPGMPGPPGPPGPPGAPAPPPIEPILRMTSTNNISVEPGEVLELTVTLRNVGTDAAINVFTVGATSAEAPFSLDFLRNTNSVNRIGSNSNRNMTLQITVDANAVPGSQHSIRLDHFYRDANNHTHESSDTIHVRIAGEVGEPNVRLGSFQMNQGTLAPGQTFTVVANIENAGTREARDVQVSPISTDNIFFTGDASQFAFRTMAPGHSGQLHFTFQTDTRIESGTFRLDFIVSYRDENGNRLDDQTFEFRVHVYAPEEVAAIANVEIRNLVTPTARLHVGRTDDISFFLYNVGETEVRGIQVQAHPETGLVPMSLDTIIVPVLAPGQGVELAFSFMAVDSPTTLTRTHTVRFNISDGDDLSFNRFAAINVYNPRQDDEEDPDDPLGGRFQIPRVIVSEYSVYPIIPRAGREFDMEITFRNTNNILSVNNIRITLEAMEAVDGHGSVFVPVGGSNTIFIDYLAPGGEVTRNLTFFTVPDAAPRSYNLRVVMDYQDAEMRSHEASEQLSISVAQTTRLEVIWQRPLPEFASAGDMIFFEYRATNTGRVDLFNVRTRMESDYFDTSDAGGHIGQLRAQSVMNFSGRFMVPFEPGEFHGTIVLYGEDVAEAIVEYRYDFTIVVGEAWIGGGGFDDWGFDDWGDDRFFFGEWDEPLGFWNEYGEWVYFDDGGDGFLADIIEFVRRPIVWIIAAAVIVTATAVIIIVVVRMKRRSRVLDFDEDDE